MTNEEALAKYRSRAKSPEAKLALKALEDKVNAERAARRNAFPESFRSEARRFITWARNLPRGMAKSGRRAVKLLEAHGLAS